MFFEEYEACVAAGLSLSDWDNGFYDRKFKERVVAWYQLHMDIKSHSSDAEIEQNKKNAKKANRKK